MAYKDWCTAVGPLGAARWRTEVVGYLVEPTPAASYRHRWGPALGGETVLGKPIPPWDGWSATEVAWPRYDEQSWSQTAGPSYAWDRHNWPDARPGGQLADWRSMFAYPEDSSLSAGESNGPGQALRDLETLDAEYASRREIGLAAGKRMPPLPEEPLVILPLAAEWLAAQGLAPGGRGCNRLRGEMRPAGAEEWKIEMHWRIATTGGFG